MTRKMSRQRFGPAKSVTDEFVPSPYLSPREVMNRWRCARSSVDRYARHAGLTRIFLGEGKNGSVRFLRNEIEAYEAARTIVS